MKFLLQPVKDPVKGVGAVVFFAGQQQSSLQDACLLASYHVSPMRHPTDCPPRATHAGQPVLLPLTESLYVSGTLESVETVLLEIGTGYYVEVCVGGF